MKTRYVHSERCEHARKLAPRRHLTLDPTQYIQTPKVHGRNETETLLATSTVDHVRQQKCEIGSWRSSGDWAGRAEASLSGTSTMVLRSLASRSENVRTLRAQEAAGTLPIKNNMHSHGSSGAVWGLRACLMRWFLLREPSKLVKGTRTYHQQLSKDCQRAGTYDGSLASLSKGLVLITSDPARLPTRLYLLPAASSTC